MAAAPAPWEPRVDFVVGGVQKGGTTSLDRLLRGHRAIAMASDHEPHWFDRDDRFAGGAPDVREYHARWGEALATRLCGDATPAYLWWPGAAERVRDYHPGMKWILLLRDPAERAYAHWLAQRERGADTLSFDAAIDAEAGRLRLGRPPDRRRYSYVDRGYYARQLARLWSLFPREQTLVLRSEDWFARDARTAEAVASFLGVDPFDALPGPDADESAPDEPLPAAARARLLARYDDDLAELERMLGWDLADWRR